MRFSTLPLTFVLLLCSIVPLRAQDVPEASGPKPVEDLTYLEQYKQNETEYVQHVRAYDKRNVALAMAEVEEAKVLARQGKEAEGEAVLARARERIQQVQRGYQYGLALFGRSARLHNYYGELQFDHLGDQPGALKSWHDALTYDDELDAALNNLGLYYVHVGRYGMGIEFLEEAHDLDSKNPDYMYNLVQIYLVHFPQVMKKKGWSKKKLYKNAMKLSKNATKYAPDDFDVLQDYAVNFFAAENFDSRPNWRDALKAWQAVRPHARRKDEIFYTWLNEGRVALRDEKFDHAEQCFGEALKIIPDNEVAKQLQAEAQVGGK